MSLVEYAGDMEKSFSDPAFLGGAVLRPCHKKLGRPAKKTRTVSSGPTTAHLAGPWLESRHPIKLLICKKSTYMGGAAVEEEIL